MFRALYWPTAHKKTPTLPNLIDVKTQHAYTSALPPRMKPGRLERACTRAPTHIHHITS